MTWVWVSEEDWSGYPPADHYDSCGHPECLMQAIDEKLESQEWKEVLDVVVVAHHHDPGVYHYGAFCSVKLI